MKITKRQLRKTIRRVLSEGMKELGADIENAILAAPTGLVGDIKYASLRDAVGTLTAPNGETYTPSQSEIDAIIIQMIQGGMLEIRATSEYR